MGSLALLALVMAIAYWAIQAQVAFTAIQEQNESAFTRELEFLGQHATRMTGVRKHTATASPAQDGQPLPSQSATPAESPPTFDHHAIHHALFGASQHRDAMQAVERG